MNVSSRIVPAGQGRVLRVVEAGQPGGLPVLVHHGTPASSNLYHRWVEDARARGIRLIGYDRPGYGGSTPHPERAVASVADDVAAIAKALEVDRLAVWGISGGGPHALACAALLPDLVVAAAALAAPAPYAADGLDWLAGMGDDNIVEFGAALESRAALERFVETATPDLLSADPEIFAQAWRSLLSPVDAGVLTQDFATYLIGQVREGIQEQRDGWIDDDIAFTRPWGFDLSQIRIPVLLLHGEQDQFVPFSHGKWLADRIAGVDARLSADDGHLSLATRRVPEVHAWLVSKL